MLPLNPSPMICQGDSIDIEVKNILRTNWLYFRDTNSWSYNKYVGCENNDDCPYNNYCFNCSLCQSNNCPGCPSNKTGSCYPIQDCFVRNDSLSACKQISDSCDCASLYSPFSDQIYLKNNNLGCDSNKQCYLQDSINCNLPNFTKNNQNNLHLKKCSPTIDSDFIPYCEWSDSNYVLSPDYDPFDIFNNQAYLYNSDSNMEFLKISNQNINFKSCYQKCLQKIGCSGIEAPNDESYCGLWMNGPLKIDSNSWKNNFQGKTLILKQKENKVILPAIFKSSNIFTCPIPSRYSMKAHLLQLRIIEKIDDNSYSQLSDSKSFLWSFCSNCTDLFSENFDSFAQSSNVSNEICYYHYQDGVLQEFNSADGSPESLRISKQKISLNKVDYFMKYKYYDCHGRESYDYITIKSDDMNEEFCAEKCLALKNCSVFEMRLSDYRYCFLWINPMACNTTTMYPQSNHNLFMLGNHIKWSNLTTTNHSVYGYYLYIHKLKFSKKNSDSFVKLYLKELNSNLTFSLFDSTLFANNSKFDVSELTFNKLKFIAGDYEKNSQDVENAISSNSIESKIIHALDDFLPILNKGKPLIWQFGIEQNIVNQDAIDISGLTFVITDWGTSSSIKKSIIPSKQVSSCMVLNETYFSLRQNKTVPKSQILLQKNAQESFPSLNQGELFFSLGCYLLYGANWEASMPAFIESITTTNEKTLNIILIHDLLLTDVFSFAKIDTSKSHVLSLKDAFLVYEGLKINITESNSGDNWYIEPNGSENYTVEDQNYISYQQGNYLTPKLNIFIKNSTVIRGIFTLEAKFYSKIATGFDTRGQNVTERRILEFSWKAEKYINMAKGKVSKKIIFFL